MIRSILAFLLFLSFSSVIFGQEKGFIVEGIGPHPAIEGRKKMIEQVLMTDEMYFGYRALAIVLDSKLIEPRGQMQGKQIRLSPNVKAESEFLKLLVHEIAHYVDIYFLTSSARRVDPSLEFYKISWADTSTKKSSESLASFISGYAATNQYEDFAESFTFYVFHNEEFAARALKNESLRRKYLFFSEKVFPNELFWDTDFATTKIPSYLWDTTKIPISVKKYLYFLN